MSPRAPRPTTPAAGLPGMAPLQGDQSVLRTDGAPVIVTGEGVALGMAPASMPGRAVARLVDCGIAVVLLMTGVGLIGAAMKDLDEAYTAAATLAVMVLALVAGPVAFETLSHGRSPGKMLLGLRVIRDDAGPIRLRHAVIRGLVAMLEIWSFLGLPALVCSVINDRGKRFGDLLAGTYVVTERPPARQSAPLTMPPLLAAWAAGIDLGNIPDPLARTAREMLGRRGRMTPAAAAATVATLAGQMRRYVAPGPPPGTPDDAFIAAVLVERRRRDLVRLDAAARRRHAREKELTGLPYGLG